ncbi:hypothetical protein FIBSPDRAFT_853976 [Athelia psychrophila]|uniref:Uncharacterized protein n=1 Tax=Athelia psychrophila TaxID=1759441 RepID=A0A166QIW9_9AGAM|nr:hypothetical protein FIBSPDRAFT_853976 [Fibularhizoctonia sp. CBS 109695]
MPAPLAIPDIRVLQHLPASFLPHLQKQCLPRVLRPLGLLTPTWHRRRHPGLVMHPRPRRVPPATYLPPRPVALRDRGPTRADAGAFYAFPHGIVDWGEWRSR